MASYLPQVQQPIDTNFKTFENVSTGNNGMSSAIDDSLSKSTPQPLVIDEDEPCVDIIISNVVCSFNTRCHLNLKRVATEGMNVVYKREQGMVSMKLRSPKVTASIWSSGKIACTGSQSEDAAKVAARKVARCLQNIGFKVRFSGFRVVNVLGSCSLPFGIRVNQFARSHPDTASYEPELHPGVTYRIKSPKACLKIFSTGSITVTAPSVFNVQSAIEHIYPLVAEYRMELAANPRSVVSGLLAPAAVTNPQQRGAALLATGKRRPGRRTAAPQRQKPRDSGDGTESDYTDDEDSDYNIENDF